MTSDPDTVPRSSRLTRRLIPCGLLWLWAVLACGQAAVPSAITGDGTLGTTVTQSGQTYTIGGGTLRGSNLFQSLERFSVGTGDTAAFTGPTGTTNILSRVTGGQPSAIDGILRSEIAGANLYLLNPNGVLFGSNARLEVSGSFHVSTADYLRFGDGATFAANLGQASTLTMADPVAFGFLGSNPAPITIQGSRLQVPTGKALSVVGGDIEIVGRGPLPPMSVPTLGAPRGRIQLASVATPGEVGFSPLELAPDLQVDSFARLGRLALSQGAFVDVSGNGGGRGPRPGPRH
jgi:filamentous hemagglutinin family protein